MDQTLLTWAKDSLELKCKPCFSELLLIFAWDVMLALLSERRHGLHEGVVLACIFSQFDCFFEADSFDRL